MTETAQRECNSPILRWPLFSWFKPRLGTVEWLGVDVYCLALFVLAIGPVTCLTWWLSAHIDPRARTFHFPWYLLIQFSGSAIGISSAYHMYAKRLRPWSMAVVSVLLGAGSIGLL